MRIHEDSKRFNSEHLEFELWFYVLWVLQFCLPVVIAFFFVGPHISLYFFLNDVTLPIGGTLTFMLGQAALVAAVTTGMLRFHLGRFVGWGWSLLIVVVFILVSIVEMLFIGDELLGYAHSFIGNDLVQISIILRTLSYGLVLAWLQNRYLKARLHRMFGKVPHLRGLAIATVVGFILFALLDIFWLSFISIWAKARL